MKGISRVIRECKFDTSLLKVQSDAVAKTELPGLKRRLDIVSLTQNDELCAIFALLQCFQYAGRTTYEEVWGLALALSAKRQDGKRGLKYEDLARVCKMADIPLITAEELVFKPSLANLVGNSHFLVHTEYHVAIGMMSW